MRWRKEKISSRGEGSSVKLRGWLFVRPPKSSPAITMAHGYAGVTEHGLATHFARAFAGKPFVG